MYRRSVRGTGASLDRGAPDQSPLAARAAASAALRSTLSAVMDVRDKDCADEGAGQDAQPYAEPKALSFVLAPSPQQHERPNVEQDADYDEYGRDVRLIVLRHATVEAKKVVLDRVDVLANCVHERGISSGWPDRSARRCLAIGASQSFRKQAGLRQSVGVHDAVDIAHCAEEFLLDFVVYS